MATPTEAEVQAQLRAAADLFETFRANVDGSLFNAGGKVDTLQQAAEGVYLPSMIDRLVTAYRDACSSLLSQGIARTILEPVLFEYGPILAAAGTETEGRGSAYREPRDLQRALYEWLHDNSETVQSRAITYDTTPTTENFGKGTAIVGNGALGRLTVDEFDYNLEACTVERKQFVCRADRNTGARENAELFEVFGEATGPDNIRRAAYGSGDQNRTSIVSKHAGQSAGGSVLQNSSFDSFDSTANTFAGWTNAAGTGGSQILQDATNYYRTRPGATTGASLKLDSSGAGSNITVTQERQASWRDKRVDPNTPMFLRIMVNKAIGSATGGDLVLSLGDSSVTVALSAIAGSGWDEIVLPFDEGCWPRQFNPSGELSVSIDWQTSSSSGFLLIDDVILAPWDEIDGTYWVIRGNAASHTPWALDDVLSVKDTGGDPSTGKIQWLFYLAGLGYLPSSGSPTIADP